MPKRRLDVLLAERGLFPSRTRAAASVMAGEIQLGASRRRASKPGELVDDDELVAVLAGPRYASRGGVKLANALAGHLAGGEPAGGPWTWAAPPAGSPTACSSTEPAR